jgi:uracil-DNA glycosylase
MAAIPALQSIKAPASWPQLRIAMLDCTRCTALVRSRSRVVPGDGEIPAGVAFVGLAPGRFGGDRTGIPFSGDRSGELLRRMILRVNLPGVFITNVVRCNPRDSRGRNRDPDAREISNCRGHLEAELALARPRLVVGLGRIAWRELAGRAAPFSPRQPATVRIGGLRLFPDVPSRLRHSRSLHRTGVCA